MNTSKCIHVTPLRFKGLKFLQVASYKGPYSSNLYGGPVRLLAAVAKISWHEMSNLTATMHEIRFSAGTAPQGPAGRACSAPPVPPARL